MEVPLRAALLAWLRADPALAALNGVSEEMPVRAALPWLAIATSASADWSCKTALGREVRLALELHARGDRPDAAGDLVAAIEARIAALPRDQPGFTVVTAQFLRARVEQQGESRRAILLEYRFRLLAD
ncbi:DUF3168 domain-containing protein [Novosphingobium sp. JCM 18896]|uniref:DUF3168 domain-containing protein n=1 Tax=Novosphingobium sp. JCM 18896 TaxID=2989731 RepID=UPI0022221C86|nr:DUF3168 domain-containing protein [Novosphingobium sp. JCM 18896]MCW1429154.1 DUF3168 domain-containing protein [Novosphingobium sp. JCM 18896]